MFFWDDEGFVCFEVMIVDYGDLRVWFMKLCKLFESFKIYSCEVSVREDYLIINDMVF